MALRHALFLALLVTCSAATGHSGLPGERLSKLRELLSSEPHPIRILETHSGLTGLIAETADVGGKQFHGMWSSSLTSSALRGKPDIETVDTTARLAIVTETLSVTTKPMIYDADTGGHPEIFKFTVRALEQLGVSACIIEDKTGLKQNSLFGTERTQTLDDIPAFCEKIKAGREARQTEEFMVIARIEALIAGYGMEEALKRGLAYAAAGADALMIHSKQKSPDEVLEFIKRYKEMAGAKAVPIVVVPSSYNTITEAELGEAGASICIYANHMLRAAYPAMRKVAESILTHGRSSEADADVLPIKKVIELIDEDPAAAASGALKLSGGALKLSGGAADQAAADQLAGPDYPQPAAVDSVAAHLDANTRAHLLYHTRKDSARARALAAPPKGEGLVDPLGLVTYAATTLGLKFFGGVPDSCIATFCAELDGAAEASVIDAHVIAANEGAAIGQALGHHLATGHVPLVYMQNSGLGNAVNPLMSACHSEVYGCPMVLLIGWRGAPGTKDEPQHGVQGRQTVEMLHSMEIETHVLAQDDAGARRVLAAAVQAAIAGSRPVAVLVPPKTFAGKKAVAVADAAATKPTREAAIATVLKAVGPSDVVVSTTGYASRELFEAREKLGGSHDADFLTVGSMGHAIAIAQGIALAQPHRAVWCLDGDGAALMHLGSLVSSASLGLPNLRHVLLNNAVHDSVGGQPTAASMGAGQPADFTALARAAGYRSVTRVSTAAALAHTLTRPLAAAGPLFVEVEIALGTRDDLGRPTKSTADQKAGFMQHLATRPVDEPPSAASAEVIAGRSETGDPLLLTPGPLTTSARVKEAMMHDYGSRDPEFVAVGKRVREQLLEVVNAAAAPAPLACVPIQGSGTFAVEAMLVSLVPKRGGKLLILANGAYGARMATICKHHGLAHEVIETDEAQPLDAERVHGASASGPPLDTYLREHSDVTHVAVVHCETTTGVLNPIDDIAHVVARNSRALLIDAMSSFGVCPIDAATTPFDAVAASSNKGLQGSPGMGFVIAKESALRQAAGNSDTLVLDLHGQWAGLEKNGQWRFTPPTHTLLALSAALDELEAEGGPSARRARYTALCTQLRSGMQKLGFVPLLADDEQAPTIVTFKEPKHKRYDFEQFYKLLALHGYVIYPGKLTKGASFRVGCIGHLSASDMAGFLAAVEAVMAEMGVDSGMP